MRRNANTLATPHTSGKNRSDHSEKPHSRSEAHSIHRKPIGATWLWRRGASRSRNPRSRKLAANWYSSADNGNDKRKRDSRTRTPNATKSAASRPTVIARGRAADKSG